MQPNESQRKAMRKELASLADRPTLQLTNELVAGEKVFARLSLARGLALGVFVTAWPVALFPSSLAYTLYLVGVGAAIALVALTDDAWSRATRRRALLATIAARAVQWEIRQRKREGTGT